MSLRDDVFGGALSRRSRINPRQFSTELGEEDPRLEDPTGQRKLFHAQKEEHWDRMSRQRKARSAAGLPEGGDTMERLHFTHDPAFKVNPNKRPVDVGQQGADLFTTHDPSRWRHWVENRPYAARLRIENAVEGHDYTSGRFGSETLVYSPGTEKVKVLGVHRAHIFRTSEEGRGRQGWKWAGDQQDSGPKISPMLPRQPMLPGFNDRRLRPSKQRLRDAGRTNLHDEE